MKLLDWMHRKLRQNSSRDFAIGQPSLDDQQFYQRQYGTKPIRPTAQREYNLRNSFAGLDAARVEDDDFEKDPSSTISELFHGFLAIGTMGTDPAIKDPSTPTFSISFENTTEKETEVTENELKLINDELERVLGAEAREDCCNDSSRRNSHVSTGRNSHVSTGRNSHVSTGRSSHGSIITLSGKPMEVTESNVNGSTVCPLQGYLFGSSMEFPETTIVRKEYRTSLGELFQRTKEENSAAKYENGEKRTAKEGDKSAVYLMKKLLKRKLLHASKSSAGAAGGMADSASAETKLSKILHMFNRKVHPESSSASTGDPNKPRKNETKNNISYDEGYTNGDQLLTDEDIILIPQRATLKRNIQSQSNPTKFILSSFDSNENKEHWVKTDADYLVLEL